MTHLDLTVVGLGYIGLPTAALFAASGLSVSGVDINETIVEQVNAGRSGISEPGLDELLDQVVGAGRLRASTEIEVSTTYVIAVPTPMLEDKTPDMRFVKAATEAIAPHLVAGCLVILESTSPVGATNDLAGWLATLRPDLSIAGIDANGAVDSASELGDEVAVVYCPERVLPGNILHELVHNDRLIGGVSTSSSTRGAEFYQHVVKGECHITNARTAEMVKLTENSFRDVNIAFANELSVIAEEFQVDVWELIKLANLHPRVNVLNPGVGVGGHCIAVDPWFIASATDSAELIRGARTVNDRKPAWVVDKIEARLGAAPDTPVVALLGLAYKPDVDDLRESPSIEVARELLTRTDARIVVVEPNVDELPPALVSDRITLVTIADAIAESDLIVELVAHREFLASAELGALADDQFLTVTRGTASP